MKSCVALLLACFGFAAVHAEPVAPHAQLNSLLDEDLAAVFRSARSPTSDRTAGASPMTSGRFRFLTTLTSRHRASSGTARLIERRAPCSLQSGFPPQTGDQGGSVVDDRRGCRFAQACPACWGPAPKDVNVSCLPRRQAYRPRRSAGHARCYACVQDVRASGKDTKTFWALPEDSLMSSHINDAQQSTGAVVDEKGTSDEASPLLQSERIE